jgi:hypothetical protein
MRLKNIQLGIKNDIFLEKSYSYHIKKFFWVADAAFFYKNIL